MIIDLHRNPHAPINFPSIRLIEESAASVVQEFADPCLTQVLDLGIKSPTVIPRYPCSLMDKAAKQITVLSSVDGLGVETNSELP